MTLTPEKLDELGRLAELVTPGPWELKDGRTDTIENAQGYPVCTVHWYPNERYSHGTRAAYIAALDPATVRELVRLARIGLTSSGESGVQRGGRAIQWPEGINTAEMPEDGAV